MTIDLEATPSASTTPPPSSAGASDAFLRRAYEPRRLSPAATSGLSEQALAGVHRLLAYQAPPGRTNFGKVKQAGVLVILFERPDEPGLRVLLTTRSKSLRSHPGQTALPGGKIDPTDPSPSYTAYREAYEETSLPLPPHPSIYTLTTLAPFLSKYNLIVHPTIALVSDLTVIDSLVPSPAEVDKIWEIFLDTCWDFAHAERERDGGALSAGDDWAYDLGQVYNHSDIAWREGSPLLYRMHRFRTHQTPIKGLTSDILIETASIAHAAPAMSFAAFSPGQSRETWGPMLDLVVEESMEAGWEERRRERESRVQH